MPDVAYCPLAGISLAFGGLSNLQMALLSGRSVTPGPLVGTSTTINPDVMAGVGEIAVTGWTAPVDAGQLRVETAFTPVTFPAVPTASGPITGVRIRSGTVVVYHALFDPANEVATTDGDVTISVGADGLLHVYAEVPA
jgi:hypothetical protein